MKLECVDAGIEDLCRVLEELTTRFAELNALVLPVLVIDDVPGEDLMKAHRTTPAAYSKSRQAILVVRSNGFFALERRFQKAILMHEIAHAHAHVILGRADAGDEVDADIQACRWGVMSELVEHRRLTDPKYGDLLALLDTKPEKEVREEIARLRYRRLAGIEKK